MTGREQIIAAYLQVSDGREWAINGVDEPVPAFYAIAFEAGRQAERESINLDDGTIDWRGENEV